MFNLFPKNEPEGQAAPAPENSGNAGIQQAAEEVFNRHAPEPGQEGQGAPALGAVPMGDPNAEANRLVVRKTAEALFKALDGILARRLATTALRLTGDRDFAITLTADTRATDEEIGTVGELSATLAEKYGFSSRWAPEFGLVVVLGGYAARQHFAQNALEERVNLNRPKGTNANSTQEG